MGAKASQITSLTIVYSTVYSGTDQTKHQSSTSQAFVRGTHRWPVNSPHKGPVTPKMFLFDDVIMCMSTLSVWYQKQDHVKQTKFRFHMMQLQYLYTVDLIFSRWANTSIQMHLNTHYISERIQHRHIKMQLNSPYHLEALIFYCQHHCNLYCKKYTREKFEIHRKKFIVVLWLK